MPLGNWNLQWLNHNSQRSYPFTDDATKQDVSGSITLPDSFLVALYMPVHAGLDVEPQRFYIQQVGIFPTGLTLSIGYNDESGAQPVVGTVNIPTTNHTENTSYAVAGVNDFDDTVGKVVIGNLDEVNNLPPGSYTFDSTGGALETDCIRPEIRGIVSVTLVNSANSRSARLYGDLEFIAGNNMRITSSQVAGQNPQIRWDAIEGEGLNETCVCEEEPIGPCIRTINGIPPLPDGNFRLLGDDCISVTAITNGVQLADQCSEPCCGCEELDALVRQIDRFADGAVTLTNFVSDLQSEVTEMSGVVLGSRLGDQGCVDC
jgi:hypothetical protein